MLDLTGSLSQVLGEVKPGDDIYYLLGLDVIGQESGSTWDYFGYDSLGSVRFMTDTGGVVDYAANYDPYGSLMEQYVSAVTSLGFTGEYTDPSGLLYLRARYASLSTATFLTMDPIAGMAGGHSVTWNPYLYVHGNPVNLTDPSGEFPLLLAAILVGAIVGAIINTVEQIDEIMATRCDVDNWWDALHHVDIGEVLGNAVLGAVAGGLLASGGAALSGGLYGGGGYVLGTAVSNEFLGTNERITFKSLALNVIGGSLLGAANGALADSYVTVGLEYNPVRVPFQALRPWAKGIYYGGLGFGALTIQHLITDDDPLETDEALALTAGYLNAVSVVSGVPGVFLTIFANSIITASGEVTDTYTLVRP